MEADPLVLEKQQTSQQTQTSGIAGFEKQKQNEGSSEPLLDIIVLIAKVFPKPVLIDLPDGGHTRHFVTETASDAFFSFSFSPTLGTQCFTNLSNYLVPASLSLAHAQITADVISKYFRNTMKCFAPHGQS